MKLLPVFLLLACSIAGCQKTIECGNAEVCVINYSSDTLYYCWECTSFSDTLLPGSTACHQIGAVEVKPHGTALWVDFNTSSGNYQLAVDQCKVVYYLQ